VEKTTLIKINKELTKAFFTTLPRGFEFDRERALKSLVELLERQKQRKKVLADCVSGNLVPSFQGYHRRSISFGKL
jgi:hypothetical protein